MYGDECYPSTVKMYYYLGMSIFGQRLRAARTLRAVTQQQLAAHTGNSREAVSMVERGRAGWSHEKTAAAARALDVSADYLHGLSDDPRPAGRLLRELTVAQGLEDPAARAAADDDGDFVGVSELASAAGDGADVYDERITGRIKFLRSWLARHGLAARNCRIIQVSGESMEPTLVDGCSILVNHAVRRRHVGHIYVVRSADGLVVKRAGRDEAGAWQLVSDNPNKHLWPTRPWPPDAAVVGEVKWAARTFA